MFCFSLISYFKLCAGYPSKRHWFEFLGIVTITAYIISYLSDGSRPPSKLAPLAQTSSYATALVHCSGLSIYAKLGFTKLQKIKCNCLSPKTRFYHQTFTHSNIIRCFRAYSNSETERVSIGYDRRVVRNWKSNRLITRLDRYV